MPKLIGFLRFRDSRACPVCAPRVPRVHPACIPRVSRPSSHLIAQSDLFTNRAAHQPITAAATALARIRSQVLIRRPRHLAAAPQLAPLLPVQPATITATISTTLQQRRTVAIVPARRRCLVPLRWKVRGTPPSAGPPSVCPDATSSLPPPPLLLLPPPPPLLREAEEVEEEEEDRFLPVMEHHLDSSVHSIIHLL